MRKAIVLAVLAVTSVTLVAFVPASQAQLAEGADTLVSAALSQQELVTLQNTEGSQEELPGLGHKFVLYGSMMKDSDPENPVGNSGGSGGGVGGNEDISAVVTPGTMAFAFRNLPPGIKIAALDNQLGFKYFMVGTKTCAAGSPRITLWIDSDGDGDFDFAAHGHVSPPTFTGCPPNKWMYENLTDDLNRWEVTPGGIAGIVGYVPWETLEGAITTTFPNHRVFAGFLLDGESCGFGVVANCGEAHYDLLTIENRTLEIWHDAVDPKG